MSNKSIFKPVESDYDIKKIYEQLELELIASLKRTLGGHTDDEELKEFNWPQWQALKLKQMNQFREDNKELLTNCQSAIKQSTIKLIRSQFEEGARKVNKEALSAGILDSADAELGGSFFKINDRKIKALSDSVLKNLEDTHVAMLRQANDIYRSTIFKASMMQNFGAKTLNQAIDMATNDFLARGFKTIQYKDGSMHSTADYADMAVRTATKRANLMGEGEFRKKLGNPLVYVSKHSTSCDKCGKWQGRVYIDDVWSGGKAEDGKYPLLSTAINGGLYHPRCQHGQSTYFEDINNEPEEIQENEHNQNEEYIQELQRRKKQYERLATGSLYTDNIKNYSDKAQDLQNKIENAKISEDEEHALNSYISSDSYKINEKLRNAQELNEIEKRLANNLDNMLEKMENYEGNIVRVLEIKDKEELDKFIKKNILNEKVTYTEYLSFSSKAGYNNTGNIEIWVQSKTGKDIRKFNPDESEILYKRNSSFITKNIKRKGNKYYILWEEVDE